MNMNKCRLLEVLTLAPAFVFIVCRSASSSLNIDPVSNPQIVADPRQDSNHASKLLFSIDFSCLDKETILEK